MTTPPADRRGGAATDEPREALDQLIAELRHQSRLMRRTIRLVAVLVLVLAALLVVLAYFVWETAP